MFVGSPVQPRIPKHRVEDDHVVAQAWRQHWDVVRDCIREDPAVLTVRNPSTGSSLLHAVTAMQHCELVEECLAAGASPVAVNHSGHAALDYALHRGATPDALFILRRLVDADPGGASLHLNSSPALLQSFVRLGPDDGTETDAVLEVLLATRSAGGAPHMAGSLDPEVDPDVDPGLLAAVVAGTSRWSVARAAWLGVAARAVQGRSTGTATTALDGLNP
jgi:hypothetical protein